MPRFYFHLFDDMASMDEEGKDLPSIQFAHQEAIRAVRAIACAEVVEGHLNLDHRIEIADETGEVLDTVRFRDVVKIEG